ncbi:MAG: phosphotransferase [Gammaproteobacteria bacterium]|jgi:N-acetylmuramate 1-kinase|nr:phosphotransferase [Gammaproteobacteria bacterium]
MSEGSTIDNHHRTQSLQNWFQSILGELSPSADSNDFNISLVQGDASFRRYFRAQSQNESYILVDAPPDKENSQAFVDIAETFRKQGVQVPLIYKLNLEQGFLCISDFGDTLLWSKLKQAQGLTASGTDASPIYQQAFKELLLIQKVPTEKLPPFSEEKLLQEMELFQHWFCEGILKLTLSDKDKSILSLAFDNLSQSALSQDQLCVHRDYHSRNLLQLDTASTMGSSIGVIDFQDAVKGPATYDLVSLLKDCYIAWPLSQVHSWALEYRKLAIQQNIFDIEEGVFIKSFDLMGAQRHLKAIGIFSRLYLRDQKITYLTDIPRTLSYLYQVAAEHTELNDFHVWLEINVMKDAENKILSFGKKESRDVRESKGNDL